MSQDKEQILLEIRGQIGEFEARKSEFEAQLKTAQGDFDKVRQDVTLGRAPIGDMEEAARKVSLLETAVSDVSAAIVKAQGQVSQIEGELAFERKVRELRKVKEDGQTAITSMRSQYVSLASAIRAGITELSRQRKASNEAKAIIRRADPKAIAQVFTNAELEEFGLRGIGAEAKNFDNTRLMQDDEIRFLPKSEHHKSFEDYGFAAVHTALNGYAAFCERADRRRRSQQRSGT